MSVMDYKFSEWIDAELHQRGWSYREFSRRVNRSHSYVTNIANGTTEPDAQILRKIADAFNLSPEDVFRRAGLLPPETAPGPGTRELTYLFDQLSDEDQEEALIILRGYVREKLRRYTTNRKTEAQNI